jgi:hypothetical protein
VGFDDDLEALDLLWCFLSVLLERFANEDLGHLFVLLLDVLGKSAHLLLEKILLGFEFGYLIGVELVSA